MPEDNNPLTKIEDKKGQMDLGVMAVRTYQGALLEADNWWEAFLATSALFSGMFHPAPPADDDSKPNT